MQVILTTKDVPPRRQATYWEEMVSKQFVSARCVPVRHLPFSAQIKALDLGALELSQVSSQGTDVLRTPAHVAEGAANYFLVSLQVKGIGRLFQAGRSVILKPGAMVLYDTSRPYALCFAAAQQQLVMRIPRSDLIARHRNVESLVGLNIPRSTPAARLAVDLMRESTTRNPQPFMHDRRSRALALIDLVLDGLTILRGQASTRPSAVRLEDAQRVALLHLTESSFSVAKWAGAMGISARYLRLLFDSSSQSPAQYLWQQRLRRAASEIRDPGRRSRSITDIALGCGFSDSAHFSRAFRAMYGVSPRDYRSES